MQVSDYIVKKYGRTVMPRESMIEGRTEEMDLADLIAVILGKGSKYESVFSISERIIKEYGSKTIAGIKDPKKIDDMLKIGLVNSCKLVAAFELGRRFYDPPSKRRILIRGPEDIYNYSREMSSYVKEFFRGIYLNTRNYVIHDENISVGHLTGSLVHPREVFKTAIDCSAHSVIVVHNHPSGENEPSKNDDEITKILKETGEILQIPVVDHVIIAENGYYSYSKAGRL
ncbi:MAG TPA: DNA repair protein RadC [Clostridiales bacterium]|jgi:DNA repair protein RadC|nr:DNA repair protein RadC [Clostridiales bacterium]HQP70091.1 DNA repair protein RadC [Clostridiales bacterium]